MEKHGLMGISMIQSLNPPGIRRCFWEVIRSARQVCVILQGIVYDHAHLMHGVHFFGEQCELAASKDRFDRG